MNIQALFSTSQDAVTLDIDGSSHEPDRVSSAVRPVLKALQAKTNQVGFKRDLLGVDRQIARIEVDYQDSSLAIQAHCSSGEPFVFQLSKTAMRAAQQQLAALGESVHLKINAEVLAHADSPVVAGTTPAVATPQAGGIQPKGELPIPDWIHTGSARGGRLYRFVARFLLYYRLLLPAVSKKINEELLEVDPRDLRSGFEDILATGDEWADRILRNYPAITSHYGGGDEASAKNELVALYRIELLKHANAKLEEEKLSKLQDYEIRLFDVRKTVKTLSGRAASLERAREVLSSIAPDEMPFELLQEAKVNHRNGAAFRESWERTITALYTSSGIKEQIIDEKGQQRSRQADTVAKLLHAVDTLPDTIKAQIEGDCQTALGDVEAKTHDLLRLVIDEGAYYSSKLRLDCEVLDEKRRIYYHEIKLELDHVVHEAMEGLDVRRIAAILSGMPYSLPDDKNSRGQPIVRHEPESFLARIMGSAREQGALSADQLAHFGATEEEQRTELSDLFLREVVKRAREQYALTDRQLASLRQLQSISSPLAEIDGFVEAKSDRRLVNEVQRLLLDEEEGLLSALHDELPKEVLSAALTFVTRLKTLTEELGHGDEEAITTTFTAFEDGVRAFSHGTAVLASPQKSWYSACLLEEQVITEVGQGEVHPSGVSNETMTTLMKLSNLCERGGDMSNTDKISLMSMLDQLSNRRTLETLKVFGASSVNEDLAALVPGLFRRFVTDSTTYYKLPRGITMSALSLVREYAHFCKQYTELQRELDGAQAILAKGRSGEEIGKRERITYRQLAKVSKLARYSQSGGEAILFQLRSLGIEANHLPASLRTPTDSDCFTEAERASTIMTGYHELLMPAFSELYVDGTILGYNDKKKERWTGRKLPPEDRLTGWLCDGLTHGIKAFHNEEGKLMSSHVFRTHKSEEMPLYQAAISDAWKMEITALIPPKMRAHLTAIEWTDQDLDDEYREIERTIHASVDKRYIQMSNDSERRVDAGLASLFRLLKWVLSYIRGKMIKAHQLGYEQDFEQIWKQFFTGKDRDEVQICSEFVSKSTLAAIMELNKRLIADLEEEYSHLRGPEVLEELGKDNVPSEVADYLQKGPKWGAQAERTHTAIAKLRKLIARHDGLKENIELIIRMRNKEILDLPYDRKEDFTRIHPGRMVKLLVKKGCAQKLDKPPLFDRMIRVS